MKQYRPDVERQRWLYSMMKSHMRATNSNTPGSRIDDLGESDPGFSMPARSGEVRCVADVIRISDQIRTTNEREYLAKLPSATAAEAAFMLARFLTPKVAEAGLHHPEESVRQVSLGYLKELAEEGDPFAREILEKLK
jgi:hypothetical protein